MSVDGHYILYVMLFASEKFREIPDYCSHIFQLHGVIQMKIIRKFQKQENNTKYSS